MSAATTLGTSEILLVAKALGIELGGLEAQITLAEAGEMDREQALNAMRALLIILQTAEGAP